MTEPTLADSEIERLHSLRRELKARFLSAQRELERAREEMRTSFTRLEEVEIILSGGAGTQLEFKLTYEGSND